MPLDVPFFRPYYTAVLPPDVDRFRPEPIGSVTLEKVFPTGA